MKKVIILIFLIFILVQLGYFFKGIYDSINEKVKTKEGILTEKYYEKDDRQLFFYGVTHVANKRLYEQLEIKLDSLSNEDFILFYEEVTIADSLATDELYAKVKFLFGENIIGTDAYYMKEEISKDSTLTLQDNHKLKSFFDKTLNADLSFLDIVNLYEEKAGVIDVQKKGNTVDKDVLDELIHDFRERNVVDLVENYSDQNIVIVFGVGHSNRIQKKLIDKGWNLIHQHDI